MTLISVLLTFLMATLIDAQSCPAGFLLFQGACYKLHLEPRTMIAEAWCRSNGGELASVHNAALNSFLVEQRRLVIKDSGDGWHHMINTRRMGNSFVNTDGTPLDYTNWASGYPKLRAHDNCVRVSAAGKWLDVRCSSMLGPVACTMKPS